MADRDYRAEFLAYVDNNWPSGDYVRSVLAIDLVEDLRRSDPDLLAGWLEVNAEAFVTRFIGDRDRNQRSSEASTAPKRAFKAAAEKAAAGDTTAMSVFAATLVVNEENLSRPIGSMTKADHLFVAGEHVKRSNVALFEAAFHKAVAKKIPAGKTTADVLTEAEYERLHRSIRAGAASAA